MKIKLTSVLVPDQEKAFRFYTLVLEPNAHVAAKAYQQALFDDTCGNLIQLYQA